MHALLANLIQGFTLSGWLPQDAAAFLHQHECPNTAAHSQAVAETAARLAACFDLDPDAAATAGWLHDISAVIPNPQRLQAAQQLGLPVLPEEAEVPLLLHQKLSAEIARQVFSIRHAGILSAIGCHTTLKAGPAALDLLLFVADKLSWDQKGRPPYAAELEAALNHSLRAAAWVYQRYLWHSGKLKVIHPWMRASYLELKAEYDFM